jgi:hypothetical protein
MSFRGCLNRIKRIKGLSGLSSQSIDQSVSLPGETLLATGLFYAAQVRPWVTKKSLGENMF